jgi:UDP-N-acetylglucosamine--N-acetylmuramyl-(pentapeptide) pyrophosphoryl-undecaprenol N-acetylglucosamine transferase
VATTVLLAAGGTGGHLFPAQALAEELARRGIAVELATDERGLRYQGRFPARAIHAISSATLGGRDPLAMTRTAVKLSKGVAEAYALLGRLKPAAVVGFGGYPTFPPLLAARLRKIPSALHEQNAILGRANRMLARRVTLIATSFETTKLVDGPLAAKARYTGNPVRDMVRAAAREPYMPCGPGGTFHLVVFGGSQGARFFSDTVPAAVATLPEAQRRRLLVTQQARPEDRDRVAAAYATLGVAAEVADFFADLPARMAHSHLVIGRAGASSVAELTVLGRPSILVPLPHALDNDQLHNATRVADAGGALLVEQAKLTPAELGEGLARLMDDPGQLAAAAAAAKVQGRPDAVERLADLVVGLALGGEAVGVQSKGRA